MAGVLYWCAFAGASLGAVVVALETRNPGLPFPVFAVILIVGLGLAGWIGKQTYAEDGVDTEEDNPTRTLCIGVGAVVAFFVTGGIVVAYVLT